MLEKSLEEDIVKVKKFCSNGGLLVHHANKAPDLYPTAKRFYRRLKKHRPRAHLIVLHLWFPFYGPQGFSPKGGILSYPCQMTVNLFTSSPPPSLPSSLPLSPPSCLSFLASNPTAIITAHLLSHLPLRSPPAFCSLSFILFWSYHRTESLTSANLSLTVKVLSCSVYVFLRFLIAYV